MSEKNYTNYHTVDDIPLVLRIEDLMSILSIGRGAAYALIHSQQVRSIRIGRFIRIPRDAVVEYLSSVAA